MEIRVPGDKSITHRALLLAALATGRSTVVRPLAGADTLATAAALRSMGIPVSDLDATTIVEGRGLHGLRAPGAAIDCGNSGTTARLLMGILAGYPFPCVLTGDASLRSRPMRRVTTPLSLMGATFEELEHPDRLPVRIHGGALRPLRYDSPYASAQVKTAIMLAGLTGSVDVVVTEPLQSRDHTERMLAQVGVPLRTDVTADGRTTVTLSPVPAIDPFEIEVPGDPSSAAFVIAFALLCGHGQVTVRDVGLNPGRTGFMNVVQRMGGRVRVENVRESCGEPLGDIVVERSTLRALAVGAGEIPSLIDEIPILAVLAARAEGTSVITGAEELRVKESDRIRTMVENLRMVGVDAEERPDGMIVHGGSSALAGTVRVHGDHRIAMAFGVLSAAAGGDVNVDDAAAVDVSFPDFWTVLERLGGLSAP